MSARKSRKGKTMAQLTWFLVAITFVCVAGLVDDVIRHALVLVPIAIVLAIGTYALGRRHGARRPDRTRSSRTELELAQARAELAAAREGMHRAWDLSASMPPRAEPEPDGVLRGRIVADPRSGVSDLFGRQP